MDLMRIRREFAEAERTFALLELHSTADGALFVRTALQTTNKKQYVLSIRFPDSYPNAMPSVYIDAPAIGYAPHRYDCAFRRRRPRCPAHGDHVIRSMTTRAAHELDGAVGCVF
jgi:hypothetical protein